MASRNCSALRALAVEYKSLQEEPVEGFCVKLVNDDNLFEWEVAIFGPPDTLYMGGCFKVSPLSPRPICVRAGVKIEVPNRDFKEGRRFFRKLRLPLFPAARLFRLDKSLTRCLSSLGLAPNF